MDKHYADHSAVELADLVRSGAQTPFDLIDAAQAAAEAMNPALNALTNLSWDAARVQVSGGVKDAPFAGVPILIKETSAEAGKPWTFGSRGCSDNIAKVTDGYVQHLLDLGFVPVARSNVPELGLLDVTEPVLNGPTRNPWNTDHTAGGSSGGASAAVAAGIVPFAHGTDGGGSLRSPASHTGLFTLKPTRRRLNVPYTALGAPDWLPELVGHLGLCRSVRDIATILEHIPTDPASDIPFDQIEHRPLGKSDTLRIGVITTGMSGQKPDGDVLRATQSMAQLCKDLGHSVTEIDWPFDAVAFHDAFFDMWKLRTVTTLRDYEKLIGRPIGAGDLEPFAIGLADGAHNLPESAQTNIARVFATTFAAMDTFYTSYDVLLTPVAATPPVAIGHHSPTLPFETTLPRAKNNVVFTPLANAYGNPSMSVPAGFSDHGLPIGAMFSAAKGRDGLLMRLAYALEEAAPWAHHRPPLFAGNLV